MPKTTNELCPPWRTRVLVTGAAGFVGHEVVRTILTRTDWEVVCLDRLDTSGTLNRLAEIIEEAPKIQSRLRFVWHDLKAAINDHVAQQLGTIDVILHIAAASHVDRSIQDPVSFAMDNVIGTANLLEYSRRQLADRLKLFLYFNTDEVFGPAPSGVVFDETSKFNCTNPYAATKAGAGILAQSFYHTYRLPVVVSYTTNVFGRRQHPEKFIPLVMRRVLAGETVQIHADPTRTVSGARRYVSAEDVAAAVLFLIHHCTVGETYAIVGTEELSNLEVAEFVAGVMGGNLKYKLVDFHSARPGHDLRYALSGVKLDRLGWRPTGLIREQIRSIVEWTLSNDRWL